MFPQSTSVFTCADTKLTKKRFWLQMNKLIRVVEIVEHISTVLTLFRCFLPNSHCSHDSSLNYWLIIYCHIINREILPASDEQLLGAVENFETICQSVLLAYDNDCCVNMYFKCAGNFWLKGCSQMKSPSGGVGGGSWKCDSWWQGGHRCLV